MNIKIKISVLAALSLPFFLPQSDVSAQISQPNGTPYRIIKLDYESANRGPFTYHKIKKPKIGLALSGGGLRGFAHIGVLEVFEREGIPIDYIASSSIGAIVGALYAIGYSPAELEQFAVSTDWRDIFVDTPERASQFIQQKNEINKHLFVLRFDGFKPYIPPSISQGQNILTTLNSFILRASFNPQENFDQFRVPINIVATNMLTGEEKVFDHGDLARIIMGSISIPLLFSPVNIDGEEYYDAGLVNNIPTNVARNMGSDIVVAVNTTAALRTRDNMNFPWEISDQVTTIMQIKQNEELLKLADLVIEPELRDRDAYDFGAVQEFIELGRKAAIAQIPAIKEKFDNAQADRNNDKFRFSPSKIKIRGNDYFSDEFVLEKIKVTPFKEISEWDIKKTLEALFETGFFKEVYARIYSQNRENVLEYQVIENPKLDKFIVAGNTLFSEDSIKALFASGENTHPVFNTQNALSFIRNVSNKYDEKGASLARITKFEIDTTVHSLTVVINEGRIHEIRIIGNELTRSHVIRRDFSLKKGDIFDFSRAQNGIRNLFGTGLFERVHPQIFYEENKLALQINLEEKKPEMMRLGARYDNDHEVKGYVELLDDNFLGTGMKSLIHTRFGQNEHLYKYQFRADRIFVSYLNLNADFHYWTREDVLGDENADFVSSGIFKDTRIGGKISIGRQIGRLWNFSATVTVEDVKIEAFPDDNIGLGKAETFYATVNERSDLRTIRLQSVIDTRDELPYPTGGQYLQAYYETAGSIFGGKLSYVKIYASLQSIQTFNRRHTFAPRLAFGTADDTLPFSQRFRAGGLHSFYGKKLNSLHGRQIIEASLAYRYKLPLQNLFDSYFKFRYDIINITENSDKFGASDFKFGLGGAISIALPIGPLELGYGVTVGEVERFYFSLGHDF